MNSLLPFNASCPRCGGDFRCGAQDKTCACFDLKLGPELRQQLAAQFGSADCLCIACLSELKASASGLAPQQRQPDQA